MIRGCMVDKASGSRRVRKSCEDCRYVLDICDGEWREGVDDSDDIDDESICELKPSDPMGLNVSV